MALPFGVFWVLLFFMRKELGVIGLVVCAFIGLALLAGFLFLSSGFAFFVIGQVVFDVVLILALFGGDIRIN